MLLQKEVRLLYINPTHTVPATTKCNKIAGWQILTAAAATTTTPV